MIPPTLDTGRENEPALQATEAASIARGPISQRISSRRRAAAGTGTVVVDPWEHSSTTLAHHTHALDSLPHKLKRTQSMNGPGPTSLCACCSLPAYARLSHLEHDVYMLLAIRQRHAKRQPRENTILLIGHCSDHCYTTGKVLYRMLQSHLEGSIICTDRSWLRKS